MSFDKAQARRIQASSQAAPSDCTGWAIANLSFQRILPVACITTNNVMIDPIVIARPVKPMSFPALTRLICDVPEH